MLIVYPDADTQILEVFPQELVARLEARGEFRVFQGRPGSTREYLERVREADAILLGWGLPNEVIAGCERLKIVSFTGIGVNNFVDLGFATQRGIVVTNTPGYGDNAVAEHALALMFAVARRIVDYHNDVKGGVWNQARPGLELRGKVLGVLGLGRIGSEVARKAKALGMHVYAYDPYISPAKAAELGVELKELTTVLATADFLSLHIPLTDETRGMIGKKEIAIMKPGVVLINTARAELVDTAALAEALESGKIAGAGIDVFDEEPISAFNPLLKVKNVVLTPHVGFNTPEATVRILEIAVENLVSFFDGRPVNVVNPEALTKVKK